MQRIESNQSEETTVSVNRQFWKYVLPTVGAMLVSGLYQVIDGIFIGRYIGADGLAGINQSWPVIGSIYGIGMLVGVGSGAVSSLLRGEGKEDSARQALGNGLSLLLIYGFIAMVLLGLLGQFALDLQGSSGLARTYADDYLQVLTVFAAAAMGSMALPFMVRNDGSPAFATVLIALGAVLNIGFNALFIVYMEMGLKGAALGTACSQLVVTLGGLAYFFSPGAKTRLGIECFKPELTLSVRISTVGLSSLLMYAYFSFITSVHNYLFMTYGSSVEVGAFAIVGYISALYYLFAEGVTAGTQPLISYHHGAREYGLMKQFTKIMLWVAVGGGVVTVVLVNLFAEPIVAVFNNGDEVLSQVTITGIRLHLIGMFLDGLIFATGVFFQSLGIGRKATFITLANMIIQLPFLLVLPKLIGLNGIWISVPLSNVALSVVVIWMMKKEWQRLMAETEG